MERYPVEYTKNVKLKDLKVGDVIEPAWLWEPRLTVVDVTFEDVEFDNGEVRNFADWQIETLKLVKIRMSKTPEWFGK
jgi:hypothetical protein